MRWRLSPRLGRCLAVCLASLAGGCLSSSLGDRHFNNGDYVRAAAAYEQSLQKGDSLFQPADRALYRLALIYTSSESPLEKRERGQALLQQLLDQHPKSAYRLSASLILELQRTLTGLQEETSRREARIDTLFREVNELQRGSDRMEDEAGSREDRIEVLIRRLRRLSREVEQLTDQVAQREAELERLKEIDLARPP